MSKAIDFEMATKGKYPDTSNYFKTVGPGVWASREEKKNATVKYEITFIDGSKSYQVLNHAQYYGLRRSKWQKSIKTVGGLGHYKAL